MNRRWAWLVVGWLGLGLATNASADPDAAAPPTPVSPQPSLPGLSGPFDDGQRDALQRQLVLAELELKLAETRAKITEAKRRTDPPAQTPVAAVAVTPPPAAPVATVVMPPVPAIAPTPPPPPPVAALVQRQQAGANRVARRRGDSGPATVGYIAQAGQLRELRQAGGGRLRAVPIDTRRPLLRPGPGVIADPVGSPAALAAADSTAPAGSKARWQRTIGGAGDADLRGIGLPPPLPGLPAGGGQ